MNKIRKKKKKNFARNKRKERSKIFILLYEGERGCEQSAKKHLYIRQTIHQIEERKT